MYTRCRYRHSERHGVVLCCAGIGISSELREWFLQWLTELDKVLAKKLNNHRATAKVAEMANAYRFAACGCVVVS